MVHRLLKITVYISLISSVCNTHTEKLPLWAESLAAYDENALIKRLQYNPSISLHRKNNAQPLDNEVTVYAHAWGDSQKTIDYLHRNADFLPDTVLGFDFIDANFGAYIPSYKKSNFCQSEDIAPLALILALLDNCGIERINLFGHSRGAGTILTTLARLHRYGRYSRFFKKLGISKKQARRIIEKVARGTIVLNCPLIDMDMIIKNILNWLNITWGVDVTWASPLGKGCVLPVCTKYKPFKDSPLKAAHYIKDLNFKILIYTEQQDMVVGNTADAALYTTLMGPDTYFYIGNDKGHVHTSSELTAISKAFYARYHNQEEPSDILESMQPFSEEAINLCAYHNATPLSPLRIHTPIITTEWLNALKEYPIIPLMKKFGYNPAIRVYPSDSMAQNTEAVTLYVHGYGEYQEAILPFFQSNSYLLPGTIVSFNFQDVIEHSFIPNFTKSNVGQTGDIRSLALMLKVLDDCNLETIHLFGTSRGGATTLNTLARLCTYQSHAVFFAEVGISEEQALRILTKIKRGTIVLNCPFIDSRTSAEYWFKSLSNWVLEKIAELTEHNVNGDQGIESAAILKDQNFTILVHFEHNDTIVGNNRDADFYTTIMGPNTYLLLGNDGGHLHSGKTLGAALQAFRYKHGGAYYPDATLLIEGEKLLSLEPLIKEDVDAYVAETYAQWH